MTLPNTPAGHEIKRLKMFDDRVLSIILGSQKEEQGTGRRLEKLHEGELYKGYLLFVGHFLGPLGWLTWRSDLSEGWMAQE